MMNIFNFLGLCFLCYESIVFFHTNKFIDSYNKWVEQAKNNKKYLLREFFCQKIFLYYSFHLIYTIWVIIGCIEVFTNKGVISLYMFPILLTLGFFNLTHNLTLLGLSKTQALKVDSFLCSVVLIIYLANQLTV